MGITYKYTTDFTKEEITDLFLSVNWLSGRFPDKLFKALQSSPLVITAWHGSRLVGLLRGLDDGCMTAFLHYLLVRPDYQGHGIATRLIALAKERYSSYLYINVMPDERQNVAFYERQGFNLLTDGAAMQIRSC